SSRGASPWRAACSRWATSRSPALPRFSDMSGSEKAAFITHGAEAWARVIVKRPGTVLLALVALGVVATWATTRLTIEKDQLKLISQDLPEVKEVQKVIDMVGGAGYLM